MSWYLTCIRKYATFSGRARRKEYWMFILFNILFAVAATLLDNVLGTAMENSLYGLIYVVYVLFVILPGVSAVVRRLHDIGKSGAYYFITLIPIIGGIWLLVLLCTEGTRGENQYGLDPKA